MNALFIKIRLRQLTLLSCWVLVSPLLISSGLGQISTRNEAFVDVVESLRTNVIPRDSNRYVAPTAPQRQAFRDLVDQLQQGSDLGGMVAPAMSLNYEVVVVNDGPDVYHGLTEKLVGGEQAMGWGSYFVRQGVTRNVVLQAVHPLADINTPAVAAQAFVDSQAQGFFMAGAHRHANGLGTADTAHLEESILLEAHQSFTQNGSSAWQVHGFDIENHTDFPANTDAVLSSGTGSVTEILFALDEAIDTLGSSWKSHVFNTLDVDDPRNGAVNEEVDGSVFSALAATTNVQQQFSTAEGVPFVHIELEQSFRIDGGEESRLLAANAISQAIIATTPLAVPEPQSITLVLIGICVGAIRRQRSTTV